MLLLNPSSLTRCQCRTAAGPFHKQTFDEPRNRYLVSIGRVAGGRVSQRTEAEIAP